MEKNADDFLMEIAKLSLKRNARKYLMRMLYEYCTLGAPVQQFIADAESEFKIDASLEGFKVDDVLVESEPTSCVKIADRQNLETNDFIEFRLTYSNVVNGTKEKPRTVKVRVTAQVID